MELVDSKILNITEFGTEIGCQLSDAVFFVIEGSFTLKIKEKTELITKNELVCFPSDMFFERKVVDPLSFYYVKLTGNDSMPFGRVVLENPIRMLSTLQLLHSSYQSGARDLANHFLIDVFMQIEAEKISAHILYDRVTNEVIRYFKKNINEKISLSDLSAATGFSTTGIIEHFKLSVGCTPFRYLTLLRIALAEELLLTSDLTLAEISSKCGYDTPFYLSNTFKKEKGISPREYRRIYRI